MYSTIDYPTVSFKIFINCNTNIESFLNNCFLPQQFLGQFKTSPYQNTAITAVSEIVIHPLHQFGLLELMLYKATTYYFQFLPMQTVLLN